jgi:hypothetical protein
MPHLSKFVTYSEFINEAILLIICYHFALLTDLVADLKTVDQIGQSLVLCLGSLLLYNIGMMLIINYGVVSRKFKLWRLARNQKKMIVKAQQKALEHYKIKQEIKKEK